MRTVKTLIRLVCIFAGSAHHFVGFVFEMAQFISCHTYCGGVLCIPCKCQSVSQQGDLVNKIRLMLMIFDFSKSSHLLANIWVAS